ncbi:MAG TPA: CpaF family protein, partial [Acidimicrobiia bacterium]
MGLTGRLAAAVVGSDTALDRRSVESYVRRLAAVEAPLASTLELRRVVDEVVGLGVVEELLRDDEVTDVLVNRAGEIWIERGGVLELSGLCFEDDGAVIAAIERVITPLGLRIDRASPIVDARLP